MIKEMDYEGLDLIKVVEIAKNSHESMLKEKGICVEVAVTIIGTEEDGCLSQYKLSSANFDAETYNSDEEIDIKHYRESGETDIEIKTCD